jgi:exopolysaccharide biosynthesis polyprenyl glycosylphosphotransferase
LAPELGDAGSDAAGTTVRRRWRRPLLGIPLGALGFDAAREVDRPIREGDPRAEVAARDTTFRRALVLADMLAAACAVLVCLAVDGDVALAPVAALALPLIAVAGKVIGLYDRDELLVNKATVDEAPRLAQLATLYTLLFTVLQGAFLRGRLEPATIVLLWGTLLAAELIWRGAMRALATAIVPVERVLFVGSADSAERLRAKLDAAGGNAVLVGRMSIGVAPERDLVTAAETLHSIVDEMRVHRVVIEPSEPNPQVMLDFVREAKGTGARVSLLPRILEVVGSSIEVDDVHGLTLLGVRRFGLSRSAAAVKRSFDFVGATILLLLSSPLLAIIALLVRSDSRGPVIYRQTRIGRDGKPFLMWKFRTMVDGADAMKPALQGMNEAIGLFKIADDPRVTRVGKRLRQYSLDELPQLVNVLRGEMSLVGPRPLVRDDDAQITGLDRRRLYLTPGMTGPWQILGSARVPLAEMIKLDYLYVTGWSLWSDVKILLRTVPYVLARRGM